MAQTAGSAPEPVEPPGLPVVLCTCLLCLSLGCGRSPNQTPQSGEPRANRTADVSAALMAVARGNAVELIDLTYPLAPDSLYWPTGGAFEHNRLAWGPTPTGYWYAAAEFRSPEHLGTHLDAPIHFAERGWTSADIPLDRLIGEAVVIDMTAKAEASADAVLTPDDLTAWESQHGALPSQGIVLVRSGWASRWPDWTRYYGTNTPKDVATLHFPGVSGAAAGELAKRGVAGVGIDTASIDPGRSIRFEAHQVLAAANIFNLENLRALDRLPARGFVIVALPMKIAGGTGGPTRVVALVPPGL